MDFFSFCLLVNTVLRNAKLCYFSFIFENSKTKADARSMLNDHQGSRRNGLPVLSMPDFIKCSAAFERMLIKSAHRLIYFALHNSEQRCIILL